MGRGKQLAAAIARFAVGGLFIYAGFAKASDPGQFIRDIWNYQLVPESFAYWISAYLPYLEILAGIALITGFQRNGARLILSGLLVVFIVLLSTAWARGLDISCGCFGTHSAETSANFPLLIARNLALGAGLALEIWWGKRQVMPDSPRTSGRDPLATTSTNS